MLTALKNLLPVILALVVALPPMTCCVAGELLSSTEQVAATTCCETQSSQPCSQPPAEGDCCAPEPAAIAPQGVESLLDDALAIVSYDVADSEPQTAPAQLTLAAADPSTTHLALHVLQCVWLN